MATKITRDQILYWQSTDKPSEMLIKALTEQGMYKLEIINQ